jgi:hypothetical protein
VKRKRLRSYRHPLAILSPVGRRASAKASLPVTFVREKGEGTTPAAISGVAFHYLRTAVSSDQSADVQMSTHANFLLVLVLATYFLCDTSCSIAFGLLAGGLTAPLWHRVCERCTGGNTNSPGGIRSVRQWVCSPSCNDRHCRPFRSVQISHNPPPDIPSLSSRCCT